MIFIAGPHGAGKTKSAEIMARFGFLCIDLGPTLKKIHSKGGVPPPGSGRGSRWAKLH